MGVRLKGGRTAPLENSGGLDRWLAVRLCAAGEESAHRGRRLEAELRHQKRAASRGEVECASLDEPCGRGR